MKTNWTIGKKLLAFGILGSTVPLLIFGAIAVWQGLRNEETASRESGVLASADLRHIIEGVNTMLISQQELLTHKVSMDLNVAMDSLVDEGGLTVTEEKRQWNAIEQIGGGVQPVELPRLFVGRREVIPNEEPSLPSPLVDHVKLLLGDACTLFQRMNDAGDMLRVATTVETKNGKRGIHTYIAARNSDGTENPVIKSVLAGQRYVGRAYVVNGWYVTAYEPLKDKGGRVIGMLFVGVPENTAKSVRDQIMRTVIGKTGYVFVLDSKGNYLISQGGQRDGECIFESRDADGRFFIKNIVKTALSLKPGESAEERYFWQNPGESKPRLKIAKFLYFAPWDWIIAAGGYDDEINAATWTIRAANQHGNMLLSIAFACCVGGAGILWWFLSKGITRPVLRMAEGVGRIALGDVTARVTVESSDEIGRLAEATNRMAVSL